MKIPGTRPFGLPKDVAYTSKNVRIWCGKENPGVFKTYCPIGAAGDIISLGSIATYLGAAATGKEDLKTWSGRVTFASIFPSILSGLHNGTLRAMWDRIKGEPLMGNYLSSSNDKKGAFLSSIETIYRKNVWNTDADSSEALQKAYDSDEGNKEVLLEQLSYENVKTVSDEINELSEIAWASDADYKDPEVKAARNEMNQLEGPIKSCIYTAGMIDDKDLIPILEKIAIEKNRFNRHAVDALIKSENRFNDGRAFKALIKILEQNHRSSIAKELYSDAFMEYVQNFFKRSDSSEGKSIGFELIAGLVENEKLLENGDFQDILLDIAEEKIQNSSARAGLIHAVKWGHPRNDALFEELVNLLINAKDFAQVDLDEMHDRHKRVLESKY